MRHVTRHEEESRARHHQASDMITLLQVRFTKSLEAMRENPAVGVWNNAATPQLKIRNGNKRTILSGRTQKAEWHTRILMVTISQKPCPSKWPQTRVADDTKTWHQTATTTNVPNHAQHEELRNRTDHAEGCWHEHGELCMVP